MTRTRWILSPVLLALALSTIACDHDRRGPLGPSDERDRKQDAIDDGETSTRFVTPVELDLEWALDNEKIPAETATEVYARIAIHAPDELELPAPPARVVLVVDTSASMKGDAIEGAKHAAGVLVDTLRDGDYFSLVVFHSESQVLVGLSPIDDDSRREAKAKIEAMQAWGTTDLSGGLRAAISQFDQPWMPPVDGQGKPQVIPSAPPIDRIVLLGDGVPNDRGPIDQLINDATARRVAITSLGYGLEFDETVLAKLAERTGGHYHFVESADAVAAMFRDEVLDLQRTVAQDIRLGFSLGPDVGLLEVIGHNAVWNPNGARYEIGLGSLAEGQDTEILVRLGVGPRRDRATVELLDLGIDFVDVQTGTGARSSREFIGTEATTDLDALATGENREIKLAAAHARTSAATLAIMQLARAGDLAGAKSMLDASVQWTRNEAKRLGDQTLSQRADELVALRKELASLVSVGPVATGGPVGDEAYRPTPGAARAVREAHSSAFNELHP